VIYMYMQLSTIVISGDIIKLTISNHAWFSVSCGGRSVATMRLG
jgi:hypothetical protein